MTLYINVGLCFSDIYGQIIVGHCFSDINGQIIVVHPSECIHLHCCFTLQLNTDKVTYTTIHWEFIMPRFQYANQEHCISEQNWKTNQRTEVVHIYTCQGRTNLNTLMYFNSLTLYNHVV